jgi:hypothetical protein
MKRTVLSLILCLGFFFSAAAHAASGHKLEASATAKEKLKAGKEAELTLKLTYASDGDPVSENDLELVHTQRVHAMVVDESLTDFQRVHLKAGEKEGEWTFTFTPHQKGSYRVWVEATPQENGMEEFVSAEVGAPLDPPPAVDTTVGKEVGLGGQHFVMTFDSPPLAGRAVWGHVHITDKEGKPYGGLQPFIGTFAYIVGFNTDGSMVLHTYPVGGKNLWMETARGGPDLTFHMKVEKKGFVKIFVNMKIEGKETYVPFGVDVN